MESHTRLELAPTVWKTVVLPTTPIRHLMGWYTGFEPIPTEPQSVMLPIHQYQHFFSHFLHILYRNFSKLSNFKSGAPWRSRTYLSIVLQTMPPAATERTHLITTASPWSRVKMESRSDQLLSFRSCHTRQEGCNLERHMGVGPT